MGLKVTAISDLHCKFPTLDGGDLLVDAGDFTFRGREDEVKRYLDWLQEQLKIYRYIVFCAGNHEVSFEGNPRLVQKWMAPYLMDGRIRYLQEESTEIDGFKIYAAPHTPLFFSWAFNVKRGCLWLHWDKIPDDTDILVTHGPPAGYGDFIPEHGDIMRYVGCEELLEALKRVQPQFHIFGHIHEAYGKYIGSEKDGLEKVVMLNAALNSANYDLVNKPHNFIIDFPKGCL